MPTKEETERNYRVQDFLDHMRDWGRESDDESPSSHTVPQSSATTSTATTTSFPSKSAAISTPQPPKSSAVPIINYSFFKTAVERGPIDVPHFLLTLSRQMQNLEPNEHNQKSQEQFKQFVRQYLNEDQNKVMIQQPIIQYLIVILQLKVTPLTGNSQFFAQANIILPTITVTKNYSSFKKKLEGVGMINVPQVLLELVKRMEAIALAPYKKNAQAQFKQFVMQYLNEDKNQVMLQQPKIQDLVTILELELDIPQVVANTDGYSRDFSTPH